MERKPTAKPSQESGPETRKRIIIKKTRLTATRMWGEKSETDKQNDWGSENTFIGFILYEEG